MATSNLWGNELEFRRTVLRVVLLVIIVAGVIFTINNWIVGHKVLAFVELLVVVLSLAILAIHKKTTNLKLWSSVFLFALYTVILIGILSASFTSALYSWLFIVPVLSYLLLGTQLGTIYSVLYVLSGCGILTYRHIVHNPDTPVIAIVNIALTLTAIWALSYTYERKRAETVKRLQEMASLDPLTGLNNRLLLGSIFDMLCETLPEKQKSVSMVLVDLDHFKRVNDKYGHGVGDAVLVDVSRIINSMRRRNDWAFRFGGEEFCLLVPDVTPSQAHSIAERLRHSVEHTLSVEGFDAKMTVSIGVARWPENGNALSEIYKVADERLYKAKEQGRNQTVSK
ncbi:GGDEF domain-containing protein [Alteromonas sp. KS69]|jgi:diguanylate cyclase (GGDEF)-like protein|uniref:GGDEF domain-containing protein n=1 Tax=Alteromonas sp. KS69 TaxID=2109917 RepID=UPI000F875333|nr:GGDEF domain-containing protein [Alteromonas sp. KS69]RUP83863.1 GGDEF domain-containing protein [Alteromonas sp. KS69]